jgi:Na+-transporting NADH:ubiquinone oxidoreductase subunit B
VNALERLLEKAGRPFGPGKPLHKFHALFEAADTFALTPSSVTSGATHVRDALDLKRMMMLVIIAMLPCIFMAMYNTGLQANLGIDPAKAASLEGWRHDVMRFAGVGYSPESFWASLFHGALYFLPLYIVTMVVGISWEVLFAIVRRHEVNEGFFVTGMLFPLICPPTLPLWEAALGISFGVVVAKEVFGGTGMNFINPALAARAFVFFAYPGDISGDQVWAAVAPAAAVDGYSGATLLAQLRQATTPFEQQGLSWWNAFLGLEKGSLGETSALACLVGAIILVATKVGSWRTMAGCVAGTAVMASLLNAIGSTTNPWFAVPFWWHMVLGGWAFGVAFMATDPVTSPFAETGKLVYGFLIGAFVVLIRVVNPAYPEAMMLVILFMNVMAPLIDYFFVKANIDRRKRRGGGHGEA